MSIAATLSDTSAPPIRRAPHDALSAGTRFGEFEILRVLGIGGFGIVYLARDHSLERNVALKEYMPAALAMRGSGAQITVRSPECAETYAIGLRSFVNEARLLARFDHPSLVKVYRFWEDNATAYMVMPYLQGTTLREARRALAGALDEAWIRGVIDPILGALELLHREGVYHRDIAPDNILLPPEGPPVLLDFGAARHVISDRNQALTAILKPSYAPIEQYPEMTQLRQGPWTDIYALGAVMHHLLFGEPPAPATARALQGEADNIAERTVPGVSPRLLRAVAWALAIRPAQRPQNAAELRAALDGDIEIPALGSQTMPLPAHLAVLESAPAPAWRAPEYEPTTVIRRNAFESTRPQAPRSVAANSVPQAPFADAPEGLAPQRGAIPTAIFPALPAGILPVITTGIVPALSTGFVSAEPSQLHLAPNRPPVSRLGLALAGFALVAAAGTIAFWKLGVHGGPADAVPLASAAAAHAIPAPQVAALPSASITAPTAERSSAGDESGSRPGVALIAPVAPVAPVAPAASAGGAGRAKSRPRTNEPATPSNPSAETLPEPAPVVAEARVRPAPREPAHSARLAADAGPSSAHDACSGRSFISLAICMDRECERPRFRTSAECVPILETKRARENR